MKLPPFEYACPTTLSDAVALLASHDGEAKPLAGGQSLVPMLAFRVASPSLLVDLRKLAELRQIKIADDGVTLGAMVRWRDILDDARLRKAHPLLVAAVEHVAHYQIRNRGTVGGSIAHADPAAEMPGIVVTCEAKIAVVGKSGARVIDAANFFQGPLMTALKPDEIITEIRLPAWPAKRRFGFQEFARRRGDFALAAAMLFYDEDGGKARNAHVGAIGVADRPLRLPAVEQVLNGNKIDEADHRQGGSRGIRVRRTSGRHPRRRRLSQGADRRHGRARAQKRGGVANKTMPVKFEVNGKPVEVEVEPRLTLADCLRHHLRLTGTHVGCEHGVCGSCTVLVDGAAVRSCLLLAVQAEGAKVVTVEGLSLEDGLTPLQASFRKHHALQCGFCTPGMITTAHALLSEEPDCDADRVREVLSGNLCRCTGYISIVEAVLDARAAYKRDGNSA